MPPTCILRPDVLTVSGDASMSPDNTDHGPGLCVLLIESNWSANLQDCNEPMLGKSLSGEIAYLRPRLKFTFFPMRISQGKSCTQISIGYGFKQDIRQKKQCLTAYSPHQPACAVIHLASPSRPWTHQFRPKAQCCGSPFTLDLWPLIVGWSDTPISVLPCACCNICMLCGDGYVAVDACTECHVEQASFLSVWHDIKR